jgi:hypothetical protein
MGDPEAYLEHNTRPEMPSFNRLVKTNINFYKKASYFYKTSNFEPYKSNKRP